MRDNKAVIVHAFSQADFDRFARLSGDNNPIHTNPVFSRNTRFGRTVAHGLLLCSVLHGLVGRLKPGSRLCEQALMFPAPTYANEQMQFSVTVTASRGDKAELELEVKRLDDDTVTCEGRATVVT